MPEKNFLLLELVNGVTAIDVFVIDMDEEELLKLLPLYQRGHYQINPFMDRNKVNTKVMFPETIDETDEERDIINIAGCACKISLVPAREYQKQVLPETESQIEQEETENINNKSKK